MRVALLDESIAVQTFKSLVQTFSIPDYVTFFLRLERYSSCRYNERQLIDVTVVRRVRPRAERWCDCEGHRRWKGVGRTLLCN